MNWLQTNTNFNCVLSNFFGMKKTKSKFKAFRASGFLTKGQLLLENQRFYEHTKISQPLLSYDFVLIRCIF